MLVAFVMMIYAEKRIITMRRWKFQSNGIYWHSIIEASQNIARWSAIDIDDWYYSARPNEAILTYRMQWESLRHVVT